MKSSKTPMNETPGCLLSRPQKHKSAGGGGIELRHHSLYIPIIPHCCLSHHSSSLPMFFPTTSLGEDLLSWLRSKGQEEITVGVSSTVQSFPEHSCLGQCLPLKASLLVGCLEVAVNLDAAFSKPRILFFI